MGDTSLIVGFISAYGFLPFFALVLIPNSGYLGNNVIPNVRSEQEREIQAVFQDLGLMNWLSFTCNRLPLLNLPPEILDAIRCGKIAYTKALAIARIKDQTQRQALLNQAIANNLSLNQIRAWIKAIKPTPTPQSPQGLVTSLHRRLLKAKLWEDPQRWK